MKDEKNIINLNSTYKIKDKNNSLLRLLLFFHIF